jgi:hypothetical protein
MKSWRVVASVVGLLSCLAAGPVASTDATRPDLSGVWQLNRAMSEFPQDVAFAPDWQDVSGTGSSGRQSGGGGGRGGGGRGGGGGGGSANIRPPMGLPESEEDSHKLEQLIAEVRDPSPALTIVQHDTAVSIADGHGVSRTFHTGSKQDIQQLNAGPLATTSKWDGGKLVIEYRIEKGRQLRYTYTRQAARLQVQVQLLERAKNAPIVRVYDAAPPNAQ